MYKVINSNTTTKKFSAKSSSITASYSYDQWDEDVEVNGMEDYEILSEFEDENNMFEIEDKVAAELGIYCDFSSIRGGYGTIFIYSDPNHECNWDTWNGPEDALITSIDYPSYIYDMISKVMIESNGDYGAAYKKLLQSYIN